MFKNAVVKPIFPTNLWIYDLEPEIAEPLNRRLFQELDELTSPRPSLPPGKNWQTEQTLHELKQFSELVGIFLEACDQVLDAMEVEHDGFRVTGCWANFNPKGSFHIPHHHPNNFLSGVYYVRVTEGAESITFHEPRPQTDLISPSVRKANQYNAKEHSIGVQPGRVVIFPSWLVHSVTPNTSDQIRISISFNMMFTSFAETIAKPKWKGLPIRRDGKGEGV